MTNTETHLPVINKVACINCANHVGTMFNGEFSEDMCRVANITYSPVHGEARYYSECNLLNQSNNCKHYTVKGTEYSGQSILLPAIDPDKKWWKFW